MKQIVGILICLIHSSLHSESFAKFVSSMIKESSGIVRGRINADVYWTHNDSGDAARLFAVTRDGVLIKPVWFEGDYEGIEIIGASNIDWEDIAMDESGNVVIGAFGNNGNARRDLCLFLVPEPNPYEITMTRVGQQIRFHYPDQDSFPPDQKNFDAEALFSYDNNYFILTKNRGDEKTKLYSFPKLKLFESNKLILDEEFDIEGLVTGADFSPEHSLLAVLTYDSIWLFEKEKPSFLGGKHFRKKLKGTKQCEAICFDGDNLIVTNEQGSLFEFSIKEIKANLNK